MKPFIAFLTLSMAILISNADIPAPKYDNDIRDISLTIKGHKNIPGYSWKIQLDYDDGDKVVDMQLKSDPKTIKIPGDYEDIDAKIWAIDNLRNKSTDTLLFTVPYNGMQIRITGITANKIQAKEEENAVPALVPFSQTPVPVSPIFLILMSLSALLALFMAKLFIGKKLLHV